MKLYYNKMGNCINYIKNFIGYKNIVSKIAIKFPHGTNYIEYCNNTKKFIKKEDINDWLNNLYKESKWNNWILYNDETQKIGNKNTSKGHCKGIVTWNNERIGWLCHSLPNFPYKFEGNIIGKIEHGELIYGQSFQYVEVDFNYSIIYDILNQISIMEAHIFLEKYSDKFEYLKKVFVQKNVDKKLNEKLQEINVIKLSKNITHLAKSPHYEIDIYEDYIMKNYNFNWKFETWIRGHLIKNSEENCENHIEDIKKINYDSISYDEKQDHSKWGVSDDKYYWVGDLNRMTSQFKRGGGGFICKDKNIVKELNKLLLKN
jgi:deoxyribonuclease-2